MTDKLVPKLRFPDFSGDWVVKKLEELTKINQGLQIPISDRFTEHVHNSYFYITNEFLKESSNNQYFIQNPPQSVICEENDILMTRTGNTGQVVTNVNGVFHNNFFKIKYSDEIYKNFFVEFLRLISTQKLILRYAGTSTIPDLNHGDFYRLTINLPNKQEQIKIADFLTSVDDKIQQLTKKKGLLEQYKKGVMQQIFSQQLRFKDDCGNDYPAWQEATLGNIGYTYNGLTGKNKDDFGNGKPYITYKQVFDSISIDKNRFDYVLIKPDEKQSIVKYGDALFTTSSETPEEVGMSSLYLSESNDDVYLNSFCFGYRFKHTKLLPMFACYLFRSSVFRCEVINLAQGSTRYNISKIQMMNIIISLACLEEQTKIANFLTSIDDKITQVTALLTQTKQYKKSLLQQMFI